MCRVCVIKVWDAVRIGPCSQSSAGRLGWARTFWRVPVTVENAVRGQAARGLAVNVG